MSVNYSAANLNIFSQELSIVVKFEEQKIQLPFQKARKYKIFRAMSWQH